MKDSRLMLQTWSNHEQIWIDVPVVNDVPEPEHACCQDWADHVADGLICTMNLNDDRFVVEGATAPIKLCPWCGAKK